MPGQEAAGRSVPAAVFDSAVGAAGHEAPRWPPAPREWPGSGVCFCSLDKTTVNRSFNFSFIEIKF